MSTAIFKDVPLRSPWYFSTLNMESERVSEPPVDIYQNTRVTSQKTVVAIQENTLSRI
jgi:hypothetical protein